MAGVSDMGQSSGCSDSLGAAAGSWAALLAQAERRHGAVGFDKGVREMLGPSRQQDPANTPLPVPPSRAASLPRS